MPRPKPRLRDRRPGEFHPVFHRYFRDQLRAREALDELQPKGDAYEYRAESWQFQKMFWGNLPYEESEQGVWDQIRDEVLEAYVREHPGRRPSAFWRFDAPEPRRKVAGGGVPAWDRPEKSHMRKPTFSFGIAFQWVDTGLEKDPAFESQAEFLRRHDLLLPGERKRLTRADFAPESLDITCKMEV